MNAGMAAARANDLYATWDAIVEPSRSDATNKARRAGKAAHTLVHNAIHRTHTNARQTFQFWMFEPTARQWGWGTITVRH